jgi:NAD(P)-dependent dehydrogenase (short-subunit alcohol dehydrogenase family)
MIAQGRGGKIINIASAAGVIGAKALGVYCAAKSGIIGLTKSQALEWGRDNILVNAICPGYFMTSLNEAQLSIPKVRKAIEDFTIVKRLASFEEITSAILWLASDCSGFTTGTHILIDGGAAAR